ncbi:MAG: sugar ABC transporter permease [Bacteroidetes bacterium SW_9_63_38]|nr:MAG: sugar ABC transporter permease [Bacteroidetes bacterium SW_9_63_38]
MKRQYYLVLFLVILAIPIYWMLNMSFKNNAEIIQRLTFYPHNFTFENYKEIITSEFWRSGYINSISMSIMNVVFVVIAAVPASYAFSRWDFRGDKHLFFWFLTNRMAPPAAFMVPFFILYSNLNLIDTYWAVALAHCLFNLPLAIWILEGFVSGIPKEIDEMAFIDGHSFVSFFWKIFLPLIAPGLGVAAFFAFMFSWVELLLARTLTNEAAQPITVTLTRSLGAGGWDWGVLAAAGVLCMVPGAIIVFLVRDLLATGFSMGRV